MINTIRNTITTCTVLSGLLILIFIAAISCAPVATQSGEAESPTTAQQTVEVTDDLGRSVVIEGLPETIVSLAPSNTEILFALGLDEEIVGVTDFCDYPLEAEQNPKVGGFSTPDLEKIVALDPDLILVTSMHKEGAIPALEGKGLTVLGVEPGNLSEMMDSIQMVGEVTGRQEQASTLVNDMKGRIDLVTDKTAELEKPRVFFVTWHDPLYSVGSGTVIHELISKAGGKNIFGDITGHKVVDLEKVIERNPGVIVTSTGHGEAEDKPLEWAKTEQRLSGTGARKNDRIYQVNADLVGRAGPRITDGLEWMAHFIHPDTFRKP